MTAGQLDGLIVADLSRALAGPHAAMMLGDLGARVIKVEIPPHGDDTRGWGPPFVVTQGHAEESTYFMSANRNKESIIVDLKRPEGTAILTELVRRADVLIENFRTGVLDKLGFSHRRLAELNPRLITLSITGFGHDGPEGGRAGYDQIAQGEAGLMSITGPDEQNPQKVGTPISDLLAGMYGAFGVLAALHERTRTGCGQVVRTSLLAATVGVHGFQGTKWTIAGQVGAAQGNHHVAIAPYGLYRCADGAVQIAVGSERLWSRFCDGFGIDADTAGFATNADRVDNRTKLVEFIESLFAQWPADGLLDRLNTLGIPAGRVRSIDEVYQWAQTRSQGLLVEVAHQTLGTITLPGPPLRFFNHDDVEQTKISHKAPPVLGADDQTVRAWLQNS